MAFTSQMQTHKKHSENSNCLFSCIIKKKQHYTSKTDVTSRWHHEPFKNMAILTHFLHLRVFAVHIASNTHASQISHHEAKLCHVNLAK